MRRILYSLSLITALLPAAVKAQEIVPLSLEEANNYALHHNIDIKNAQLDILLQKARNAEITAAAYPRINAQGQFTDYIDPVKTFVPGDFFGKPGTFTPVTFTPKFSNSATMSGSQLLFDGSVLVALQARNTVISLFEQSSRLTEENVRYGVQKAYYSLVIAGRQYNNLKAALKFAREMLHDQEVMRDNGFIEKIDIDRSNVQINNLASDSIRINNLLEVSSQLLKFQLGMDVTQPIVLTDTNVESEIKANASLAAETAEYSNRTEYNLLRTTLKLNQYDLRRYKLAALPSLGAFGNMGYTYSSNKFNDLFGSHYIFSSLAGLQLNIPIFNGMLRMNQVKEAKLNVQKTENNIYKLKLAIDFQTETARTQMVNSTLAMNNQQRNMELAATVLDLAEKKYKEGVGSNLEVTVAQTQLLQAQTNYFQAMLDVMNAQTDLQKALGLLK